MMKIISSIALAALVVGCGSSSNGSSMRGDANVANEVKQPIIQSAKVKCSLTARNKEYKPIREIKGEAEFSALADGEIGPLVPILVLNDPSIPNFRLEYSANGFSVGGFAFSAELLENDKYIHNKQFYVDTNTTDSTLEMFKMLSVIKEIGFADSAKVEGHTIDGQEVVTMLYACGVSAVRAEN